MKTIKEIFADRTCYKFSNKPVTRETLVEIYDLMKMGATSANGCPLRIAFIESSTEKDKLCKIVAEFNIAKVKSAPVTAIFAYDMKYYEKMDKLHPTGKALRDYFASLKPELLEIEGLRNSSLQAAYFMVIARSVGLACGPMSGFDKNALNEAFFKGTNYRVNFLCNLGYRDGENPYPKLPRLDFDEACKVK